MLDGRHKRRRRPSKNPRKSGRKNPLMSVKVLFLRVSTPLPPFPEEQEPNDLSYVEEQEPPPEDDWFCPHCSHSPCSFLQWQGELERIMDVMYPEATNKQKRYHMYRHITRKLHGSLGKGNCRPLPWCFGQGMRGLFPLEQYTDIKPNPFQSGSLGDCDRGCADGSIYNYAE
jgi:hypothetical protein